MIKKMGQALRKNAVSVALGTLALGSTSHVAYEQIDQYWPREFIVMRTDGITSKEDAEKLGEIIREVEGIGWVVKSHKKAAAAMNVDSNVIVEPIVKFGIPTGESATQQMPPPGRWPPPGGGFPGYPPQQPPQQQCPPVQVTCQCACPGTPGPVPPPPPNPTPVPTPTPVPQPPPNQGSQQYDYGVKMVGTVPKFTNNDARAVKVCITDTGIDTDHVDLKHIGGRNFTGGSSTDYEDRQGHGTHCAGAVAAVHNTVGVVGASQAQILVAKVLGDDGSGSNEGIAAGIKWCSDQGADVISMSLGGPSPSRVVEAVLLEATRKGVWVFVAAGNDGSTRVGYPAGYRMPGLFSVSAIDQNGQLARFSNYGKVEMTAPGVDTLSTMPGNKYARMSGTSMATPIAAGVGAMYKAVGKPIVFKNMGDASRFGAGLPTGDGL